MFSWSWRRFRLQICSGWSLLEIVVVLLTVTLGRLQQPEESLSRKHKSHVIQINVLDLVYVAWTLYNISHLCSGIKSTGFTLILQSHVNDISPVCYGEIPWSKNLSLSPWYLVRSSYFAILSRKNALLFCFFGLRTHVRRCLFQTLNTSCKELKKKTKCQHLAGLPAPSLLFISDKIAQ